MFTKLVRWSGAEVPNGRVIDGVDQRAFFEGKQETPLEPRRLPVLDGREQRQACYDRHRRGQQPCVNSLFWQREARLVQKPRCLACHPPGTRRSEASHRFARQPPSS